MAIPALDSIIDEVQAEFNDTDGNLATDALVTSFINEALYRIVDRFVANESEFFLRYTEVTTVDNTGDYALENDHIAMQKVEITLDGATFYPAHKARLYDDVPDRAYYASEPVWFYVGSSTGERKIRIRPTPATGEGGAARLRLYEYAYPTVLSGTNTPPPPLYGAYYILKYYALYKLEQLRGRLQESAMHFRGFQETLDGLITQLGQQSSGEPEFVRVVDQNSDGWRTYL